MNVSTNAGAREDYRVFDLDRERTYIQSAAIRICTKDAAEQRGQQKGVSIKELKVGRHPLAS